MTQLTPENMEIGMMFVDGVMQFNKDNRLRMLEELNRVAQPGAVVFLGDSITEGFAVHELLHSPKPLYNRGIGGYTSQEVLDAFNRLTGGINAEKVFILIGTNDLADPGAVAADIAARVDSLVEKAQAMQGTPEVYLLSVLPVNRRVPTNLPVNLKRSYQNADIIGLNHLLCECADQREARYIDTFSRMLDQDGDLRAACTYDGLHLTLEGYQELVKIIQPLI